jgi:hypothetical protein
MNRLVIWQGLGLVALGGLLALIFWGWQHGGLALLQQGLGAC